jgi:hypothetical protein
MKALSEEGKAKLHQAAGRWPDYPQLVMELAKENKLTVPFTELPEIPESPGFWTKLPKDDK